MSSRSGNVFIQDRDENQSFEEPCERRVYNQDDNQENQHHLFRENINDDQLDQLLEEQNQSKQEIVLRFKVNQLQKICNSLTETNRKLFEKVASLQQEKQLVNKKEDQIFVDEYSELNCEFTQVQNLIKEYRESLEKFQKNALLDMKSKQEKLLKLKSQVKQLTDRYNQAFMEKQDLEKQNKQLETRNEGLILEIENLQKDKQRLEERLHLHITSNPHSRSQYFYYGNRQQARNQYELPSQIQTQYENMIDKLVKELEYEKNLRKKMGQEIKRMGNELMDSERQIMSKNKKLYQIEMKLLRSSKTTADTSGYMRHKQKEQLRHHTAIRQNSRKLINRDDKMQFKNFALLQLINGELNQEITNMQRKIIGLKVVQFYQRKIERQDFSNVMPENLLVYNFWHEKPELLSIKRVGKSAYQQGEKTEQSLVWNLAFILDNLFGQNQDVEDFDEILQLTGQVLEKQMENNKESLLFMKKVLVI